MIRVAMIIRSTAHSSCGGDTIQAAETAKRLAHAGFSVDVRCTNERVDYHEYSLLHFFNITRPADILYHIRKTNLPFVISTIAIDYSEFDRMHRHGIAGWVFRHLAADSIEYLKAISRWVRGRDRLMSLSFLWKGQQRSTEEIIRRAGMLLPNSKSEKKRLTHRFGAGDNCLVVPNGVDPELFHYDEDDQKDLQMVLCVARIEGIKNQLNLIKALNGTRFKLVLIGNPAPNQPRYYQECKKIAADNVRFISHLPQHRLVDYYRRAKVHVLPSWFETTGLSSLEAGAMGCNIVITSKGDAKEYFGRDADYCEPADAGSIYHAVERAASRPLNLPLITKITTRYTWSRASIATAEGYQRTIDRTCN